MSARNTEITINVYDLLASGRLSSFLWAVGTSLLHSGVVVKGKEYAYGGHDRPQVTGVYWTRPRTQPPGGTFKCEILHGFSLVPEDEIESIIRQASEEFQGTSYNLLTQNCNHFTAYLCLKLTGRSSPGWLNRAARIGVALPCIVPRDWIKAPACDADDGGLRDEEDGSDESTLMLAEHRERSHLVGASTGEASWQHGEQRQVTGTNDDGSGRATVRDAAGRTLPPAEMIPAARR